MGLMELRRSLKTKLSMEGLRGDGGERLEEKIPRMGAEVSNPKLVNLLTPLSLFGAKRYLYSLFVGMFILSFQNHHVVLETCCEKNKCKIFCQIAILPRRGQRN